MEGSRYEYTNNGQTLICTLEVQIIKILSWPKPLKVETKRTEVTKVKHFLCTFHAHFSSPILCNNSSSVKSNIVWSKCGCYHEK